MAELPTVLVDVEDGLATVTLSRPDHLNAMDLAMSRALIAAVESLDADPAVRAVILTGAGRAFCAGADLSSGPGAFDPSRSRAAIAAPARDWGGVLNLRLFEMDKPLVAAVNGPAVGVGATMTLPCDVRLAASTARFGFVFARRGIVTDGCASWFLPRLVGPQTALRWCLGGGLFDAAEAHREGLVHEVHEPDALLAAARTLAASLVDATSAVSVAMIRRLLWQGLVASHPMDAHVAETLALAQVAGGADAREGVASFLEKRAASFPGTVPGSLPARWPVWEEPRFPGS